MSGHPPSTRRYASKWLKNVARLELLNPKPDKRYLGLLRSGYKQSGASKDAIAALEDRIIREAAGTSLAYRIAYERWEESNKPPEDQKDLAAWRAYNATLIAFRKQWADRSPSAARELIESELYIAWTDPATPAAEVVAALDRYLRSLDYQRPYMWSYSGPADLLLERKLQPARAMTLLRKAVVLFEEEQARSLQDDMLKDSERAEREKDGRETRAQLRHSIVKAAVLMKKPDEVAAMKAVIEGPVPTEKGDLPGYWQDRGRLALMEGHRADALAYYQSALQSRTEPPRWREGRLVDDLTDEAKALWKELGGTETGYALWITPPAGAKIQAAGSEWKRPAKQIPQFELADVSGKTWKLKQLEGKAVLINVWATWCGPCQEELPKLQKLYDMVKDRPDIQVLTFNIDDNAGLVAPYIANKKYTFPVLLANDFVNKLYDDWAIPQNWLVDPAAKWRWVELGYDSAEPDWVGSMLKRVQDLKKPDKMD